MSKATWALDFSHIYLVGIPSPFWATVSRGKTSTFRLSSFRSSGVITLLGGSSVAFPFPLALSLAVLLFVAEAERLLSGLSLGEEFEASLTGADVEDEP